MATRKPTTAELEAAALGAKLLTDLMVNAALIALAAGEGVTIDAAKLRLDTWLKEPRNADDCVRLVQSSVNRADR